MANFKVLQKTKTVKVYRKSITDEEFETIERYKAMDYKIVMLEKTAPRKKTKATKQDLIDYLSNGKIDSKVYAEMINKFNKKENFLKVKSWLVNDKKIDVEELVKECKIAEEQGKVEVIKVSAVKESEKVNK